MEEATDAEAAAKVAAVDIEAGIKATDTMFSSWAT